MHGNYGNFYNNKFIWKMSEKYLSCGVSFLTFNLSAHDGLCEGYRKGILDYETMLQTECDDEYDEEYDEEDFSRNTISFPVPNPDFVLYEWLRDLEECKGWKSKRIEAEQVYQKKSSLHIYLERAFRILGIEY